MNMTFFSRFILLSLSLLLAACQESAVYTIYNNTPWNLVVELSDGEVVWMPGTPLRIDRDMQERLSWLEREGQRYPVLSLRHEDKAAHYSFTSPDYPIPPEYAAKRLGGREYSLQLQQDWNLYLMRHGDSYPAPGKHLRFQPPGFPRAKDKISE